MEQELKLVFVYKIGYHSNGDGHYEFIFSKDPSSVDAEAWGWTQMPAKGNAQPPDESHIDSILTLRTSKIDLVCLHELNDRMYIDGYYTIHALAYQNLEDDTNEDLMYDELPILVFHYGMKIQEVKDILYTRDLMFKETSPEKSATVTMDEDIEDEDDDQMIV